MKEEEDLLKILLKKINMKTIFRILVWSIGIIMSLYILVGITLHVPKLVPSVFTIYSQDFDKTRFEKIKVGMNREFVESQIGKPLRESEDNYYQDSIMDISWYTRKRVYGMFFERIFVKYYKDKVVDKIQVVDMD